jgi:tetratricopeptide (TPR) repeat protein
VTVASIDLRSAGDGLVVAAREALDLTFSDPARGGALAASVAEQAGRVGDSAALAIAARAQAVAARDLNDLPAAERHLRRAVEVASRHGLTELLGAALLTRVSLLFLGGRPAAALRTADRAATMVTGHDLAVLEMQRANVHMWQGNRDPALRGYTAALEIFRREHDLGWQATVHANRGLLHLNSSSLAAAIRDLRKAERLRLAVGQRRGAADVRQHLGIAAGRAGNLPAALGWFASADEVLRELGEADPLGLLDRVEVLASARLAAEARSTVELAVGQLAARRMHFYLPQARLRLGEVALLQGDRERARVAIAAARRGFVRQGQQDWVALCDYQLVRADGGSRPRSAAARARRVAGELEAAGWRVLAVDARIAAARFALAAGRPAEAIKDLHRCRVGRDRGPVELRSRAWHATGLLRLASGDGRGAASAVRAGLRVIQRHQASLAALELRAHAAEHGLELAALGVALAIRTGRADRVLASSDRLRARALMPRPVRPPSDERLVEQLDQMRSLRRELDEAARSGRAVAGLERRQAALERSIRERAWLATGGSTDVPELPALPALRERLGSRALVQYVDDGGQLYAVVLADGRCRLQPIGAVDGVRREIRMLMFSLRRLALAAVGGALSGTTAIESAHHSAGRLDNLLLRPVQRYIGDRELVVVPTTTLHALPWAALPSAADRPLTVAPSAAHWYSVPEPAPPETVVLAAGPGLPHALDEITRVARDNPAARVLTGEQATVGALLAALDGADLGHVAAHGQFRADNPLLSQLRLVDGPLTILDLDTLRRPPSCLLLAACDVGSAEVLAGDELIGVAAALLSMGTRTVVATSLPVPDDLAGTLMVSLHSRLRAGQRPAAALARARRQVAGTEPGPLSGFLCLGSG